MDAGGRPLPDCINPNNFPAKLWRLVNNPTNKAICWDSLGEAIIIDQHLFEGEVLSPDIIPSDSADVFKTSNFSSFVRQLNLYGFRKVDPAGIEGRHLTGGSGALQHFHNPNFMRDQPELVANLRRLTVDNKAKMQAGQNVKCRLRSRYQRFSRGDYGRDGHVKRGTSSFRPTCQESTHPYHSTIAQAMTAHNGTPVPPRYLIRGRGAPLSPTVFVTDKEIPVPLSHHYTGGDSSSNTLHIQQVLLAHGKHGNSNFAIFSSPRAQCQPGYYSPAFHCYQPNYVASHLTGSGFQTGPLTPHSFYQAGYPVNMMHCRNCNQDPLSKEQQEVKKCDVNLDTVFQIADEMMQTSSNSFLVKVETPEKPGPVSVSANADLVMYKLQEESVLSVSEQMPEDAIIEVTSDDGKDPEVVGVEVSNSPRVTNQADNSSCSEDLNLSL